jgi:hypothetical protein
MASTAHQYPGINLPLRYIRQEGEAGIGFYRLGSFDGVDCDSELIQVREVFMMILMDRLTDKPNWHEKVFDDAIVAKWRDEALTQREGGIYYHIVDGKHVPKPKRTRFMTGEAFDYVRLLSGVDLRYRISTDWLALCSSGSVHLGAEMQGSSLQGDWARLHAQLIPRQ